MLIDVPAMTLWDCEKSLVNTGQPVSSTAVSQWTVRSDTCLWGCKKFYRRDENHRIKNHCTKLLNTYTVVALNVRYKYSKYLHCKRGNDHGTKTTRFVKKRRQQPGKRARIIRSSSANRTPVWQGLHDAFGDQEQLAIPSVSTGSLGLDVALGIGGLPRGRVVEIYGPESSGKTTLTLQVIAEAQKVGGTCAFIDAEHALDPQYAQALGVDTDNLLVSQPDTGEQALEICDMLVRSAAVDVVVVDSVAALTPKAEIEGEMGDTHVGLQARLMSQALRKMTGNIKQANTMVIFINQIRMKIGVMFGSPETTTGGNALKFYSSVRLDIRRIGAVKNGDEVVGNETRVKVVKNKVAPPFRQTEFQILYGAGIHRTGEILELGVQQGIVEKSGAWYAYNGDRIGQGRKNAADFLDDNPEMKEEIEATIRQQLMPHLNSEEDSAEVLIPEASQEGLS